ncbi:recombinase family protein [Candidatus Pelagibacter sp.]|mgnify:FL=1|jgi:DNA invertase Pin-like site-specific DNA recombinase|nr:recombinase family protein [Candidatus Pelagibacter sp.]MDC1168843.1 recombinase family protein [Candidatus Pelagibacter ubique]|tara:strand:+ start:115 stop:792 length:678 start_codon:yes stop_codon:yes gene_type:complete
MSKVYVYTRNSNVEAFEKGSSRETQIKKCGSYASIKDLVVDEIVQEQCSGQLPFDRRDKAFELLKKLKTNDHIICSHLDRFCRNTLSLLQMIQKFKKKKIYLHFVDLNCEVTGSDAIGNVFLTMLSCFSQFTAEQTSQKIKSYKERMRTENKFSGGKMTFGYDKDENGFFVPIEKEQEVIREMLLMRKQGKSYRNISSEISKSTRKKFPLSWTHKIIQRELQAVA